MKQAAYSGSIVGTMFFLFTSMLGGNAAVARYMEKDKAKIHDTKFLAHVSDFITYFKSFADSQRIKIFNIIIIGITMHLECFCLITTVQGVVSI